MGEIDDGQVKEEIRTYRSTSPLRTCASGSREAMLPVVQQLESKEDTGM